MAKGECLINFIELFQEYNRIYALYWREPFIKEVDYVRFKVWHKFNVKVRGLTGWGMDQRIIPIFNGDTCLKGFFKAGKTKSEVKKNGACFLYYNHIPSDVRPVTL